VLGFPIAFFDPPIVLNASVTPIPGSGSLPLQVVDNLGAVAAYFLNYIDSTGDFIGVYKGPAGSETLVCVVGGGTASIVPGVISARSRISLRSMTTSSITNGNLFCTFLGQGLK
jgi:hypothetical protein